MKNCKRAYHAFIIALGISATGTFLSSCSKVQDPVAAAAEAPDSAQVYTDLEYTSQSALLQGPRTNMLSTSVGHKAYFLAGFISDHDRTFSPRIEVYDGDTFTWSAKFLPEPGISARFNNEYIPLQVVGAQVFYRFYAPMGGAPTPDRMKVYNLETDAVTYLPFNTPRQIGAVAVSGDLVFMAGTRDLVGDASPVDLSCELYDMKTQKTTSLTRSDSLFGIKQALALDGKIYTTGVDYTNGENLSHMIRIYDIAGRDWSSLTLPGGAIPQVEAIMEKKVIFSDPDGRMLYFFDPFTRQFSQTTVPHSAVSTRSLTVAGNLVVVAGGTGGGSVSNEVDVYNIRTDTWTNKKLSEGRVNVAGAVAGNLVVIAGGTTENNQPTAKTDFFKLKK